MLVAVQHKNHETYVMLPGQRFTNSEAFRLLLIILSQVSSPENPFGASAAERIGVKEKWFSLLYFRSGAREEETMTRILLSRVRERAD